MPLRPMPPGCDRETGLVRSDHVNAHDFALDNRYVKNPGRLDAVVVSIDFEDLCLAKAVPPIPPSDAGYSARVVASRAYSYGVAFSLDGDGTIGGGDEDDDGWVIETSKDTQVQVRGYFYTVQVVARLVHR